MEGLRAPSCAQLWLVTAEGHRLNHTRRGQQGRVQEGSSQGIRGWCQLLATTCARHREHHQPGCSPHLRAWRCWGSGPRERLSGYRVAQSLHMNYAVGVSNTAQGRWQEVVLSEGSAVPLPAAEGKGQTSLWVRSALGCTPGVSGLQPEGRICQPLGLWCDTASQGHGLTIHSPGGRAEQSRQGPEGPQSRKPLPPGPFREKPGHWAGTR